MELITTELGDWCLTAAPGFGGALTACTYHGRDVLRPARPEALAADLPVHCAAFPMVPFIGRISHGRMVFEGVEYQLPGNMPPEPHAIHGVGWQSAWQAAVSDDALTLTLGHDDDRWPFAFSAMQQFSVSGGALRLVLRVQNESARRMPAGLGWHPYFLRENAAVKARVTMAENLLPGARDGLPIGAEYALTYEKPFQHLDIDTCLKWPDGRAEITLSDGRRLTLTASDAARFATVYNPAGEDFFCFEPVTHLPNAVSLPSPEAGGMVVLRPGAATQLDITLAISAPA